MYFYDTSILIDGIECVETPCAISSVTIQELDGLAHGLDESKRERALAASNFLLAHTDSVMIVGFTSEMEEVTRKDLGYLSNDVKICVCANALISTMELQAESPEEMDEDEFVDCDDIDSEIRNFAFVTSDALCAYIASGAFGLNVKLMSFTPAPISKGYTEIYTDDETLAQLYVHMEKNWFSCDVNEYVILKNSSDEIVDRLKWTGEKYVPITWRTLSGFETGVMKPRNIQQELAFDLLQDSHTTVKVLTGAFGSGKDALMISHALDDVLRKQNHKKIVWVRNNIELRNTRQIGFLPGNMMDKLLPFTSVFIDHVGGDEVYSRMLDSEQLEILHLGCIRGRDIRDAIILCSESENLTREHVQLLLSRVGENSEIWFNGDLQQTDGVAFDRDNGLRALVETLSGNPLFGCVELGKVERSETAALSGLFDCKRR